MKELRSLPRDPVLALLIVYSFSLAIYSQATGIAYELRNASVAIVDEDRSPLSARLRDALLPPHFKPPATDRGGGDRPAHGRRRATPSSSTSRRDFQRDFAPAAGPAIQLNVDATAMCRPASAPATCSRSSRTRSPPSPAPQRPPTPVELVIAGRLQPEQPAGLVRAFVAHDQQHHHAGDHPDRRGGDPRARARHHRPPAGHAAHAARDRAGEVWANGLVITVAAGLSLCVRGPAVPSGCRSPGSIPLFLLGVALYLFFATAVGLLLGTVARSMPQLGLLFILVVLPMKIFPAATRRSRACPSPCRW